MNNATENQKDQDDAVLEVYAQIFALPQDQVASALAAYWAGLASNCSKDNPCPECLREMRWLELGG